MFRLSLIGIVIGLVFSPALAKSGSVQRGLCIPYDEMKLHLKQNFNEQAVGRGITGQGQLTEVYSTPDGSTWTIIQIDPRQHMMACPRAQGRSWVHLDLDTGA
jgi:hypothetical protein